MFLPGKRIAFNCISRDSIKISFEEEIAMRADYINPFVDSAQNVIEGIVPSGMNIKRSALLLKESSQPMASLQQSFLPEL